MSVENLIERFLQSDTSGLNSEEKVQFVFNELIAFAELQTQINDSAQQYRAHHRKSWQKTETLKSSAKTHLDSNNFEDAIQMYSQAIMSCPFGNDLSEERKRFAECYEYRSQASYQMRDYGIALYDANQAFVLYPSVKVLQQRIRCYLALGRRLDALNAIDYAIQLWPTDNVRTYLFEIKNYVINYNIIREDFFYRITAEKEERYSFIDKSKQIETKINENVMLEMDASKGRYLAASSDIAENTLILIEKPITAVILKESLGDHCSHCFKTISHTFWPCRHCDEVVFCNIECCFQGMHGSHRYECGIAGLLAGLSETTYMAYRLLTRVGCDNAIQLSNSDTSLMGKFRCESGITSVDIIDAYNAFITLFDHSDTMQVNFKDRILIESVYCAIFLQYTNAYNSDDNDLVAFSSFVVLIQTNILKLLMNSYQIKDDNFLTYGATNMYLGSIFNHSCDPNVIRRWSDGSMIYRTSKPVRSGEELCVTYGPLYFISRVAERRRQLREDFHFDCNCGPCLRETAVQRGLKCLKCNAGVVSYQTYTKASECLACGESYDNIEHAFARIESIKVEIQAHIENIRRNIGRELSLMAIEKLIAELCEMLTESSTDVMAINEYMSRVCTLIQRFDYVVIYTLRTLPNRLIVDQMKRDPKNVQTLQLLTNAYLMHLGYNNIRDIDEWQCCLDLNVFLVNIIKANLNDYENGESYIDDETYFRLRNLLITKEEDIANLKTTLYTMFILE